MRSLAVCLTVFAAIPVAAALLMTIPLTFPTGGEYVIRFLQQGVGPGGGRVAHAVYVVPDP